MLDAALASCLSTYGAKIRMITSEIRVNNLKHPKNSIQVSSGAGVLRFHDGNNNVVVNSLRPKQ